MLWAKYKECQSNWTFSFDVKAQRFCFVLFSRHQVDEARYANFFLSSNISQREIILEKYMWAMRHVAIEKILVRSLYPLFLIWDLCPSNLLTTFPEDLVFFFFPYSLELETTFKIEKKDIYVHTCIHTRVCLCVYSFFLMSLLEDSRRKEIQLH